MAPILRGELDWIVMKALEKDRARRYETASSFAADILRYLAHEPVVAGPPSAVYRLRKFVRRNRAGVGMAGFAIGAILVGLVLAGVGFVRANTANMALQSQLWESRLIQARTTRMSTRPGRRFASLDAIAEAASIRQARELRDEMFAILALDDVRFERQWTDREVASARGLRKIDRFAYMHAPGDIRIVSVDDGRELGRLSGPTLVCPPGPFSPSGKYIAVRFVRDDLVTVIVFDTTSGEALLTFDEGAFIYNMIGFGDTDGHEWFVIGTHPGKLSVYELPTARERFSIAMGIWSQHVAVDPAGKLIALSNEQGRHISMFSAESGEFVDSFATPAAITRLDFSTDGRYIAGGSHDNNVYVWDMRSESLCAELSGHQSQVTFVDFAAEGPILASSGWDSTIRIWNVESKRQIVGPIEGWNVLGFGRRLAGVADGGICFWSYEAAREVTDVRSPAEFGVQAAIAIDPRRELVVTCGDPGVILWDIRSGERRLILSDARSTGVTFAENGSRIIAALYDGLYAWRLERDDGRISAGPAEHLRPETGDRWISLCADGSTLVVNSPSSLQLVRQQDGEILTMLEGYRGMDNTPSITPDGRYVFTGSWQGDPGRVREVATGRVMIEHAGGHVVGTFSPDGRMLVIGTGTEYSCYDTTDWAPLWNAARDNTDNLAGVVGFSGDSTLLAVSRSRYLIDLLDPDTGHSLASIESPGHKEIRGVNLSEDAGLLAVITKTNLARVYDLTKIREQLAELKLDW